MASDWQTAHNNQALSGNQVSAFSGMLYSTFTAYLGFKVNEDEYKVMGLAAYGQPTLVEQVRKLIRRTPMAHSRSI